MNLARTIAAALLLGLSACATAQPTPAPQPPAAQTERYADGARGMLDVYAPAHARRAPVLVFFYGGAWQFGSRERFAFVGQTFAAQGFVTVVPDYRVYPEVRFPGFVQDAAAAIKWTQDNIARFGGDPHRIVLAGHSAGAHIATLVALDPSYAQAAGFDRRDIRGVVGMSGPYHHPPEFRDTRLCEIFCSASAWSQVEPMHFVSADDPPLLLLAGDQDHAVPPIAPFVDAAQRAGEHVEFKVYPGVDHGGTLMAITSPDSAHPPTLADVTGFVRRVTR